MSNEGTEVNVNDEFKSLMTSIANKSINNLSQSTDSDISMSDSFESNNQAKMFLVAQAKNEMQRIVRLTKFLDIVEEKFVDTSTLLMSEYPDNLELVQDILDTIMKCINRSNDLIMAIVKDEKLNSFVFNKANSNDFMYEYKDISLDSKNKIREFASKMIDRLSSLEDEDSGSEELNSDD